MRSLIQNFLSVLGAVGFLTCMAMLLTRPANFASYVPEPVAVIEEQPEEPVVRVILDAGHGGIDGGTSDKALLEKDLALTVARLVRDRVEEAAVENLEVVLTRKEDVYMSLHQRVMAANRYPESYFVSIHFNGWPQSSASGTETLFASPKPSIIQNQIRKQLRLAPGTPIRDERGKRFAEKVQRSLVSRLGSRDRGIRNDPRLVLPREVTGPAVLVECVFLSNPSEARKLRRRSYLEKVADGIAEGILNYMGETRYDPFAGVAPIDEGEGALATLPSE